MRGGHVGRFFFFSQVFEYDRRLVDELPSSEFSFEEEAAGFKSFNETFGFSATLDYIARYMGVPDDEIILKWSVNKFFTKLKMLSWRSHIQKKYGDIMNSKNKV